MIAVAWGWSEENAQTLKDRRKVFWGPVGVLFLDCGYVYMTAFICQNLSNCVVNMGEFY